MLITTDEELKAFAERTVGSPVLAVDTEFVREKVYHPQLCLIQLGTDNEQIAVDPFCIDDVSPIIDLFNDRSMTKVFHACAQDIEVLLDYCGTAPHPLFDTQIAASYISERSQVGYATLVEEYCGVILSKVESMTDWTMRPLEDAQLSYALDDVRYLPAIWRAISSELERLGRSSWPADDLERAADPATYIHDPQEAFWRVKRINSLSRRQLAVAREVAAWREITAASENRPRRRVLSDELILDIAKRIPLTVADLERIRGISSLSEDDQSAIVDACCKGAACPLEACPKPVPYAKPSVETESVCDLMYALARMIAERESIALSVLTSRDDLIRFLSGEAGPLSSGWRYEVLGRQLEELLAGHLGLTVKEGRVEVL